MAKAVKQEVVEPRERQLARVFAQVIELLVDLEPFERERVLRAVEAMYPSKLTGTLWAKHLGPASWECGDDQPT
jgi:hypothetical protein